MVKTKCLELSVDTWRFFFKTQLGIESEMSFGPQRWTWKLSAEKKSPPPIKMFSQTAARLLSISSGSGLRIRAAGTPDITRKNDVLWVARVAQLTISHGRRTSLLDKWQIIDGFLNSFNGQVAHIQPAGPTPHTYSCPLVVPALNSA